MKALFRQRLAWALLFGVTELALGFALFVAAPQPAGAQFFDNRYPFFDNNNRRGGRFWFEPQQQQPEERPVDYSRAPAAPQRPADAPAPTTKIVVLGDSIADYLAYGLEDAFSDSPEIQVVRKHRAFSGLIRYETRSDREWPQVAREIVAAEKPNIVLILLGVQDRQSIREKQPPKPAPQAKKPDEKKPDDQKKADEQKKPDEQDAEEQQTIAAPEPTNVKPGGPYEFRTEKWEEAYNRRIDEMIAAAKSSGAAVVWVGLPAIRGTRSTSEASYLNELYRGRAEKAGIFFVDVWDGFVDEQGRFSMQGPDVEGQIRRLRTPDGVHFTKFGARKLAHYVERELRRGLLNRATPMAALPAPEKVEPQQPAKPGMPAPRPMAGPVLFLNGKPTDSGELAGGTSGRPANEDATARRVLVNGDPASAAAGRADDFAWPLRAPNTEVSEPLPPSGQPVVASAPAAPSPAPAPAKPSSSSRVAGQPVLSGQIQPQGPRGGPQAQWRSAPQYTRPPQSGFFGLFR